MYAQDAFGNPIQDPGVGQGFNPTENRNTASPPPPAQPQQQAPPKAPQQQYQQQQRTSEIIANVVEERFPMPAFPMLVNTVDAVARRVPWYVWVALGAFGYHWVRKKWSK